MLKLQPAPTFKAKVGIPIPGEDKAVEIVCVFAHMTRDQFAEFSSPAVAAGRSDVDSLMAILKGWEQVDAEFSRDAVGLLTQQYHGASFAIAERYASELTKARAGN